MSMTKVDIRRAIPYLRDKVHETAAEKRMTRSHIGCSAFSRLWTFCVDSHVSVYHTYCLIHTLHRFPALINGIGLECIVVRHWNGMKWAIVLAFSVSSSILDTCRLHCTALCGDINCASLKWLKYKCLPINGFPVRVKKCQIMCRFAFSTCLLLYNMICIVVRISS